MLFSPEIINQIDATGGSSGGWARILWCNAGSVTALVLPLLQLPAETPDALDLTNMRWRILSQLAHTTFGGTSNTVACQNIFDMITQSCCIRLILTLVNNFEAFFILCWAADWDSLKYTIAYGKTTKILSSLWWDFPAFTSGLVCRSGVS